MKSNRLFSHFVLMAGYCLLLSSCQPQAGSESAPQPAIATPASSDSSRTLWTCLHDEQVAIRSDSERIPDQFLCLKQACQTAGATFNLKTLDCQCPRRGELFTSKWGGHCLSPEWDLQNGTGKITSPDGAISLGINIPFYKDSTKDINPILNQSDIPQMTSHFGIFVGEYVGSSSIFLNKDSFKKIEDRWLFFTPAAPNIFLPESQINAAVENAIAQRAYTFYFRPRDLSPEILPQDISEKLKEAIRIFSSSISEFHPQSILSMSSYACAEICIAKQLIFGNVLPSSNNYKNPFIISRTRVYSDGVPISDSVNFLNSESHNIELSLSLIGSQVSHFYLLQGTTYYLYSGDGIKIEGAPLFLAEKFVHPDPEIIENTEPVLLFEDGYSHPQIDRVAIEGPYLDESYYGWHQTKQGWPYSFGKTLALIGEEGQQEIEHASNVSQIASDDFTKSLILFPSHVLASGGFLNQISLLPRRTLIASLSFGIPYEDAACQNSIMSQIIKGSETQILWVIGAGNSGQRMKTIGVVACPQVLRRANTLIVGSSETQGLLSPWSTFGEKSVDLIESGCKFDLSPCAGNAATSYAAPRAARKIANLTKNHPLRSPEELRLALLYTAGWISMDEKILFQPVASGGFLDIDSANEFLSKFPSKLDQESVHHESMKAWLRAKSKLRLPWASTTLIEGLIDQRLKKIDWKN